ncbi:MAG: hypothetical protein ACLR17_16620 [Enterobacteriaceae bacterium]
MIHWPGTPAQEIATLTDNKDVMTTLMQRLLHVSTRPTSIRKVRICLAPPAVVPGSPRPIAIRWPLPRRNSRLCLITTALTERGTATARKLTIKTAAQLLLQVLTDEKRFIAN